MRILNYAIMGIIIGYGFPILSMYVDFVLKRSFEGIIYLITRII